MLDDECVHFPNIGEDIDEDFGVPMPGPFDEPIAEPTCVQQKGSFVPTDYLAEFASLAVATRVRLIERNIPCQRNMKVNSGTRLENGQLSHFPNSGKKKGSCGIGASSAIAPVELSHEDRNGDSGPSSPAVMSPMGAFLPPGIGSSGSSIKTLVRERSDAGCLSSVRKIMPAQGASLPENASASSQSMSQAVLESAGSQSMCHAVLESASSQTMNQAVLEHDDDIVILPMKATLNQGGPASHFMQLATSSKYVKNLA